MWLMATCVRPLAFSRSRWLSPLRRRATETQVLGVPTVDVELYQLRRSLLLSDRRATRPDLVAPYVRDQTHDAPAEARPRVLLLVVFGAGSLRRLFDLEV